MIPKHSHRSEDIAFFIADLRHPRHTRDPWAAVKIFGFVVGGAMLGAWFVILLWAQF